MILIAKEMGQMMIRNNDELKLFEETLDRCNASVLVVTPEGKQYDLKNPVERYLGIASMLSKDEYDEPELFATSREDEMKLIRYLGSVDQKSA